LRILPINVGRNNVQNPLDFVTALLVDRHKRGRLRHRGAWADAYGSSKAGNILDDNEKSIKKYIGGSNEN